MVRESRRCNRCGRGFNSEKALRQHLKVKHTAYYVARHVLPIVSAVILVAVAVSIVAPQYLTTPRTATVDRDELLTRYISGREKIVLHIHPTIKILVDGNEIQVPANIGIAPDGRMKYIHTHDATGVIHIESPVYADFTLGDFMKVWGKRFDSQCFDNYCGSVKVSVNGAIVSDPLYYRMRDGDKIVVEVTTG